MSIIYLIPSLIAENATNTIPTYISEAIKQCHVIFAENERTARRFLKSIDKSIIIDQYDWYTIHKSEEEQIAAFKSCIHQEKNIALISEAGCPGIADPGQILIAEAQKLQCTIKPLVGPSSILLALMASGLNGQKFTFHGYLPIDSTERERILKTIEHDSLKNNCTQLFIETPYRNNQLLESMIKVCHSQTKLCIAVDITGNNESIVTKTIADWRMQKPDLHKKTVVFALMANR